MFDFKAQLKVLPDKPGVYLMKNSLGEVIYVGKAKILKNREAKRKEPYKIRYNKNKNAKWLILIMAICVLTGLLTPLGDTPYTYLYKTMKGNTTKSISEHLPLTLINRSKSFLLKL